MFEPVTTIVGNLAGDPELRFTPSGAAVANFTVCATPKTKNKNTEQWEDGETLYMRCSIWREAAENVAESLHRGDRVVVTGRLVSRSWDDKDSGAKRTVVEMQADEVGPSLRYATAQVRKADRPQQGQGQWGGGQQGPPPQQQGQQQGPPQQQGQWGPPQQGGGDPWQTPQGGQQPWGNNPDPGAPPF